MAWWPLPRARWAVVELASPVRPAQAAERPLLDGVAKVAVAGEPVGDEELALARAAGDGCLACVALEAVRRVEVGDVADLAGHPGGETITEARKAQVDLAARDRRPPLAVLGLLGSSLAGCAEEQLAHAALPDPALGAEGEELAGCETDRVGLGSHQPVACHEVVVGQRRSDSVSEAVWPAVAAGSGEGDQVVSRRFDQGFGCGPALQEPQEGRGAHVVTGDRQRGGERGDQVGPEAIQDASLVAGGSFIVTGDGPQLGRFRSVGDQRAESLEAVQGEQARDAGVFGVVLLLGRARGGGR